MDGGYYDPSSGKYIFYLTDHLGNNRVIADQAGTIMQRNHYYPFGMAFTETPKAEQEKQPYKYNGKELDQMHGLNLYDYSARYYEPAIGRFTTIDPLAEKYYSISPYVYVANNPILNIDPDGRYMMIYYKDGDGNWLSYYYDGENDENTPDNEYVQNVISAYNYNIRNGGGDPSRIGVRSKNIRINIIDPSLFGEKASMYVWREKINLNGEDINPLFWNPYMGGIDENGYLYSPATILDHEIDHNLHHIQWPKIHEETPYPKLLSGGFLFIPNARYGSDEEERVIRGSEMKTAYNNGEIPLGYVRDSHNGRAYTTESPTSTKPQIFTFVYRMLFIPFQKR